MPVAMWIRHQYPRGISPQPPGSGELWQLRTQDPAGVPRPGVGESDSANLPVCGRSEQPGTGHLSPGTGPPSASLVTCL